MPADVLAEVKAKQRKDDQQIASLSSRVIAAPIKTGRDGGMHPTFLAKLKPQEVREPDGTVRYMVDSNAAKQLGSYVNPPFETYPEENEPPSRRMRRFRVPPRSRRPVRLPAAPTWRRRASLRAAPAPQARASGESGGMFSSLFASTADSRSEGVLGRVTNSVGRMFGGGDDNKPASPAAAEAAAPAPKRSRVRNPRPAAAAQPKLAAGAAPANRAGSRRDACAAVGGERLEPDEWRNADSADGQLRPALGRDAVICEPDELKRRDWVPPFSFERSRALVVTRTGRGSA